MTCEPGEGLKRLISLFEDIQEEFEHPFSVGPSWGDEDEARAEIADILRTLRAGTLPEPSRLEALFALGGLLSEIEKFSEWGELPGYTARYYRAMDLLEPR